MKRRASTRVDDDNVEVNENGETESKENGSGEAVKRGEGAYGNVFTMRDGQRMVAVKRYKHCKTEAVRDIGNVTVTQLREFLHLRRMKHPNIVTFFSAEFSGTNRNLVLEAMQLDLHDYILQRRPLGVGSIDCIFRQLLSGLEHCHQKKIMHRDIKPQNILINVENTQVKLCDFGQSVIFYKNRCMTVNVSTLWFQSPEQLLQSTAYDLKSDIWSMGCVFLQLCGRFEFMGDCGYDQLILIFRDLGLPSDDDDGVIEWYRRYDSAFPQFKRNSKTVPCDNFVQRMLSLNVQRRDSATELLRQCSPERILNVVRQVQKSVV